MMNDRLLKNLLSHLEGEWAVVAVTADEVAELRSLGLVSAPGEKLVLSEAGKAKLAELRAAALDAEDPPANLPPEPVGSPMYDLLSDPGSVLAVIKDVGDEEFERALKAEIRAAMDDVGVRVVLWYGERMDNVNAVFEEFTI